MAPPLPLPPSVLDDVGRQQRRPQVECGASAAWGRRPYSQTTGAAVKTCHSFLPLGLTPYYQHKLIDHLAVGSPLRAVRGAVDRHIRHTGVAQRITIRTQALVGKLLLASAFRAPFIFRALTRLATSALTGRDTA
jgi:hypothetical protein